MDRSLDDCVFGNYSECLYEGVMDVSDHTDPNVRMFDVMDKTKVDQHYCFKMDSVIPFFCGDTQVCRSSKDMKKL